MDKLKIYLEISDCNVTLFDPNDYNDDDDEYEYYMVGEPVIKETNILFTNIEITSENYQELLTSIRSSFPMTENLDECTESSLSGIKGILAFKVQGDISFSEIFYMSETKDEFLNKLNLLIIKHIC